MLERRREFGENRLPAEKSTSALAILFAQPKSPLVYIILAAAGLFWGVIRAKPDFRARNRVEQVILGLLMFASSIAIPNGCSEKLRKSSKCRIKRRPASDSASSGRIPPFVVSSMTRRS